MKKTKRSKAWAIKSQKTIGKHLIVDFWFGKKIEDPKKLGRVLIDAAKKAGNTPLKFSYHKFTPHGITGVLLLAESHIAFHSWPEFNFLAIDIFTCGDKAFPEKALKYLKKIFKPKRVKIWRLNRGTK
jgi:S-adenosylmethionine decarboxylase